MEDGKNLISRLEGLPSAHPKHFRDLTKKVDVISRQAAIAVADFTDYAGLSVEDVKKVTDEVVKGLKRLPSAQPEQSESEDITFWKKRAREYEEMVLKLTDEMARGIKIDSMLITEEGIVFKKKKQEQRWIPVSEKLPDDLEEVNITFTNLAPEPYYDFIKGKRFTGSAVFYEGEWYWYSSITVDVLKEYGRYESEKIDEGLKIVAWMPLPEPYQKEGEAE